jgi:CNT family concentrative nucleoside transporter
MVVERVTSFCGLFVMIGLAWLMSSHRRRVPWRMVATGVLLQFTFAALIFWTDQGRAVFDAIKVVFVAVIDCTNDGAKFLFGEKVTADNHPLNTFAFRALPVIIFFSSLTSVLYYFGIMQWVIRMMAIVMQKTLKTSGAETLSATANVFVGQTEAPLVVRPYLASMTRSELMAVMVGGFATVAGSVMAIYVNLFHVDAAHLLIASVISAPAGLVIAKVMQPEVDEPKTLGTVKVDAPSEATNVIHAAAMGATDGAMLALNVAAMLIAFLGLIALINFVLGGVGGKVSSLAYDWFGLSIEGAWSLESFLGYLFAPLAWLMGTEWGDCRAMGRLLGVKMVANEFLAYQQLGEIMPGGQTPMLSDRSTMLATYALCGFSNFGSIGVQIGGLGPLAPSRRSELAQLGLRAMLGGTLACLMTACVAGVLL